MTQLNMNITTTEKTKGRCLALFPGAFRPPHKAHFEAVLRLVSRPDIDEVIVIITNRCRHIPGTSKALDTDVAQKIWSIYLQGIPKVRVEVAPHSAVKHAQSYFERVNNRGILLFCAGESELKQGHGRFRKINTLSREYAIPAFVIASFGPPLPGGATAVRACLANGHSGYEAFVAALPIHLSAAQCAKVWQICRQGMREMHDIAQDKIRKIIEQQGIGEIDNIHSAKNVKTDEILCVQLKSGNRLYVKYANDTVKAAKLGQPLSLKPRTRIYAERRALKWLASHSGYGLKLPDVIYFDNKTKTLILSEVCPGGWLLEDDLRRGVFDPKVAAKVSRFLAYCHYAAEQVPPFWGDKTEDLQHWKILLSLHTLALQSSRLPLPIKQHLAALKCASEKATQLGFFHLDYCPKNIRLNGCETGVIDFELSSNAGDPAYDFGILLGHYIFWGIVTGSSDNCLQALYAAIQSYQKMAADLWPVMCPRVLAFTGTAIIRSLDRNKQSQKIEKQLLNIAATVLDQKLDSGEDIDRIFRRVFSQQPSLTAS